MYCSHCGAQIPDDSAFCPSCGQKPGRAGDPAVQTAAPQSAPPPQTSYAQPAPRYVETIKSEGEFIQEYRNLHNYGTYSVASIVTRIIGAAFIIIWFIWVFSDIQERQHDFGSGWIRLMGFDGFMLNYFLLPFIVAIICSVITYFLKKQMKTINEQASSEYRRHRRSSSHDTRNSSPIFRDRSRSTSKTSSYVPNGWRCPDCGRMNASYVGTCACGRRKNS